MNINTFLKEYLSYGEFEHTGYHPVKDFLSGLLDITIIIPIIDCILGEDIITGERLNDFQRGMKLAVDLFTLGQAMALTGGLEAGAKVIAKTIAVELLSNAASYTVGYGADAIGMPLPITWMLSVVTGCTVSATVGGYLFKSPDGTITKCSTEEAEEIIKNLDAGAEVELTGLKALPEERRKINSFADLMSPEDAERYLKFLENGSTAGLTKEELEGIKKVDELLALNKINYQDILDLRNSGNALKGGSKTIDDIIDKLPETTNGKGVARNFESTGGFDQTIKDFDDLNPIDVKEIQTQYGPGKVGKLSDGTTVVARPGSTTGGATLEIRVSNSKVYKIRY